MRRTLAITLFGFFLLPLLMPLLAMTNRDPDSRLPACCRRNGAHHCAMSAAQIEQLMDGQRLTTAQSKCPLYPRAVLTFGHHDLALHSAPTLIHTLCTTALRIQQAQASARVAESGARHKRGPPTVRLS